MSKSVVIGLVVVGLLGCGGGPPAPDAGPPADAGFDAQVGPVLACAEPTELTGVIDGTVGVTFDTRMTETSPRDLGLACGNTDPELRWAPQEVVELIVPGSPSETYAVDFTTDLPGTDDNFDTVVQVRATCEEVPTGSFPVRCFNDTGAGAYRAAGSTSAAGGSHLFFLVTGFSDPPAERMTVDEGTLEISFSVRASHTPTCVAGSLRLVGDDVRLRVSGADADADVRGVGMTFYGPGGALLDIYGDGVASEDRSVYVVPLDDPAPSTAGTDWAGGAWVRGADVNLAGYLRSQNAERVHFHVYDSAWAVSDALDVAIEEGTLVGLGEACGDDAFCRPEMVCSSGACIAGAGVASLCGGATEVIIPATPGAGATVTQMGTTGAGAGEIQAPGDCVNDPRGSAGRETVYRVDVAEPAFDLRLTTDVTATGDTDTILYVRSACSDSGTVVACNDDIAMDNYRSEITLTDQAAGSYFVFVERYGGLDMGTAPHALEITVTPVIASGEACDAATTRCATGTCTDSLCP